MKTRWFVYLLENCDRSMTYCGMSCDPDRRLRQHNGELDGGARTTRRGRPWTRLGKTGPFSKGEALAFEKKVKGWSRDKKLAFFREKKP